MHAWHMALKVTCISFTCVQFEYYAFSKYYLVRILILTGKLDVWCCTRKTSADEGEKDLKS